jgi:acyl-CoA thioester hydrolase
MYTSQTKIRVRYAETDQMGVVYYGNYAQYFEVGRVESIRALGYTYKQMEADGIIMPVVELHTKYLRSAKYDDLITVTTSIKELPTAHKIIFNQEVHNEAAELLTVGTVTLFFMDAKTMQRTTMSDNLYKSLAKHF